MKRLDETERVDRDYLTRMIRRDPAGWAEIESWWRSVGLKAGRLKMILTASLIRRREFEESLEAAREAQSKSGRRHSREVRTIVEKAKPFIALIQSMRSADHDLLFDDLGDRLAEAVEVLLSPYPSLKPHRPGDPWLAACVVPLARCLKANGLSGQRMYEPILKGLIFAGHEKRVTSEKIRHIVRKMEPGDSSSSFSSPLSKARGRRRAVH
jgi:hypothetical protein